MSETTETTIENLSPIDGAPLPTIIATAPSDVASIIAGARKASGAWSSRDLDDRIDILLAVKKRLLARCDDIALRVHREVGKPVCEAMLSEVVPNGDLIDYWVDHIHELLAPKELELDSVSYPGKEGTVFQAARGVVALITPWNYPVAIALRTLVPALLAGNTVVFKPSEVTPDCGAIIAELFKGLVPDGVITVLQGGASVGETLVGGNVDAVVFTGSVKTGKTVAVTCAERLIPCSLELGGKDAALVLPDCQLDRTANGIVWGAFTNAGQNCAGIERVFVHRDVAGQLLEAVQKAMAALSPKNDTAAMTTEAQHDKVRAHLAGAIEAGGEVVAGGLNENDESRFLAPTIVRLPSLETRCNLIDEETFGPVIAWVEIDSIASAVAAINDSDYALTTSIWTRDYERAASLAQGFRSGVVTVNNHGFTAALPNAPWTGTGATGYGVTNGPHCLSTLTRPRLVLIDRNRQARELWWYPYTQNLKTIARSMAQLKGGSGLFGKIGAVGRLVSALPRRLMLKPAAPTPKPKVDPSDKGVSQ